MNAFDQGYRAYQNLLPCDPPYELTEDEQADWVAGWDQADDEYAENRTLRNQPKQGKRRKFQGRQRRLRDNAYAAY